MNQIHFLPSRSSQSRNRSRLAMQCHIHIGGAGPSLKGSLEGKTCRRRRYLHKIVKEDENWPEQSGGESFQADRTAQAGTRRYIAGSEPAGPRGLKLGKRGPEGLWTPLLC